MQSVSHKAAAIIIAAMTAVILILVSVTVTLTLAGGKGYAGLAQNGNGSDDYASRYQRLDEVYNLLMDEYYVEVDSDALIQGAIDGMMASLGDPYTFYFTPDEMSATNSSRSGNYVGIGVQVVRTDDNYIRVTRVFSNSSAKEAGIRIDDIIYSADGVLLRPQSDTELTECVAKIKEGEIGTFVEIEIMRGEEIIPVSVERVAVTQDRVEYEILEGDIGYILLYDFFGNAIEGIESALENFRENDVKGLIFDVRGNPGGSLDLCIQITDYFVDGGVIVYTEDRYGIRMNYEGEDGRVELPLVILVNGDSASASEIFAAAIQEAGTGTVVGETTFGKGIVQTLYQFYQDGAGMQLTTSAYYTQSGKSIHNTGVTPDVIVSNDPGETGDETTDKQLMKALEILWEETGYEKLEDAA